MFKYLALIYLKTFISLLFKVSLISFFNLIKVLFNLLRVNFLAFINFLSSLIFALNI
jgi:hypothetical protein